MSFDIAELVQVKAKSEEKKKHMHSHINDQMQPANTIAYANG
jgi:hypothetical protein